MATLADSFLDDLDELGDDEEEQNGGSSSSSSSSSSMHQRFSSAAESKEEDDEEEEDEDEDGNGGTGDGMDEMDIDKVLEKMVAAKAKSSIGQLRSSLRYKNHLAEVITATGESFVLSSGPLETDPQYKQIVASNKVVHDIDEEILGTFRYVADIYAKKFPELENLVSNKLDYIRTVQRIGNELNLIPSAYFF